MSYGFQALRKKFNLAIAWGSLLCCVMHAQTVRTSYVPGTNFSKYHTYTWVAVKGGEHPDPSVDAQIKQSIDSQLTAKGFAKADDGADLNVDYQIAVSKVQTWQTYEDWGSAALLDGRIPQRKKVTLDVGTLVLDMYDTGAKQLVWTGSANKTIDPNSNRETRQKSLDKAAKALLKDFPPK
jgi:Domain of unknown function (DUF4136)